MHESADSGQDSCLPCVGISPCQGGLHHPLLKSSSQEGLRGLEESVTFPAAVEDEHGEGASLPAAHPGQWQ